MKKFNDKNHFEIHFDTSRETNVEKKLQFCLPLICARAPFYAISTLHQLLRRSATAMTLNGYDVAYIGAYKLKYLIGN